MLAALAVSACDNDAKKTPMELGAKIYRQQCSTCHLAEGQGSPGQQPALRGSPIVNGPTAPLVEVIWLGSNAPTVRDRERLETSMAGFLHLSDREVAAVATYIRASFGNQSPGISEESVRTLRQGPPN